MWCDPAQCYSFTPAQIPVMKSDEQRKEPVFWLDQILGGGLVLPKIDGSRRALTVLLAGPPGTGKSTLALELCYRWGTNALVKNQLGKWRTLYLTSEAYEPWMLSNAKSLGWTEIDSRIVTRRSDWNPGQILVLNAGNAEHLRSELNACQPPQNQKKSQEEAPRFWGGLREIFFPGTSDKDQGTNSLSHGTTPEPDVVVIDSLNTLPDQDQREQLFQNFMRLVNAGPRVLICVLNSPVGGPSAEFWEFATDVVFRLDRRYEKSGYLVRTIEVTKARYQEHAFGKHQLKTYQQEKIPQNESEQQQEKAAYEDFKKTFEGLLSELPSEPEKDRSLRLRTPRQRLD
jgi:KaiC/GvpD/RAD55 family RecA-like ATPase